MGLNQLAFQAVRNNGLKAQLNSTRGNASGVWRGNTHRYRTIHRVVPTLGQLLPHS